MGATFDTDPGTGTTATGSVGAAYVGAAYVGAAAYAGAATVIEGVLSMRCVLAVAGTDLGRFAADLATVATDIAGWISNWIKAHRRQNTRDENLRVNCGRAL